jgi:hypothetical protein
MLNSVLSIAIALAVPCTAFAGDKKEKSIEVNSYSWGTSNVGSAGAGTSGMGSGRVVSPTTKAPIGGSTGPTKPTLPTTGGQHR